MFEQHFVEKMKIQVPRWLDEVSVPGVAISLVNNGRPIETYYYGTANVATNELITADTIFEAASLSKPVVAYAALQLVDRGLLELDRPLVSYMLDGRMPIILEGVGLDTLAPKNIPLLEKITCRHVLNHATGLPNWPPKEGELAIHFSPGSRFSYSGVAYGMVQTIIETISDQSCQSYIQTNIFDPFGMSLSTFTWDGKKNWPLAVGHDKDGQPVKKLLWQKMIAGGSLHCSSVDYARFLTAVLQPKTDSPFYLSAELTKEMIRPYIQVNNSAPWHDDWPKPDYTLNPDVGWGLGWGTQITADGSAIWHWGDNGVYKCFVVGFPDNGVGLVIMTNSKNGDKLYERILSELSLGDYPALEWLNAL